MQYGFMQNISWTYSLHSPVLLNEMQQETNKNFYLASGLNSFNFQDRENVDIRSQLQTLEHHPRWPWLYFTVPDGFCFWPLLLIALVLGSRGCVWVRCCSKHTVLRARSDHVGSFSASSGGHTGCINRQRDESPARVTCYFGCFARAAVGPWQVSLEAAEFTCLTWWRGKVVLTRCDKLEVGLQSGDGAPGTDAAVSRKTSSK